ncbi:IS4 family transposase [Solitalea lacus]|uniref:IS4 family transposase n=1 Tax=Solitalea lacus TaxID=2911172 RepID=UPI0030B82793
MSLFRRTKNNDKPLIRQIIDLIPRYLLNQSIKKYHSDKYCHKYKTYDHLVALLFGQLCKCSTLEDISVGIGVSETFIKDLGLQQSPAKSTMSDGNKKRNWQVFDHLYTALLKHYGSSLSKYSNQQIVEEVKDKTLLIRDSSTISVCLSMFDWAKFRTAKGGLKIHTQWDESMMLPNLVNISQAQTHDSKGFEQTIFPKDTIILEDKGYWDYEVILASIKAQNTFVTRIKDNTVYEVIEELELPEQEDQHILKDELIHLTGTKAKANRLSLEILRRVVVFDQENNLQLEIITNNTTWKAATIAALYKRRWDIEIFFKQLKQNLNVKTFIGTSENAVKSQIFVALITYLLLELLRRVKAKGRTAFSNFVEKIRICLCYYLTLDYVIERIQPLVRSIRPVQATMKNEREHTLFAT